MLNASIIFAITFVLSLIGLIWTMFVGVDCEEEWIERICLHAHRMFFYITPASFLLSLVFLFFWIMTKIFGE